MDDRELRRVRFLIAACGVGIVVWAVLIVVFIARLVLGQL